MNRKESETTLSVPFRLDGGLGPNRVDVMLVMCFFSVDLAGEFTVAVSDSTFQVTGVDISSPPFELHFAEDFPVRVTDLHIERDPAGISQPGTLADPTRSGRFEVKGEVPIQVRMRVLVQEEAEWVTFRTPFAVAGTIDRTVMNLTGQFAFHLEGYSSERMPTKLGTCDVILNASSVVHCQLDTMGAVNAIRLVFAGREAALAVGGSFTIGLNGLDIRILELALTTSPLDFLGLLSTDDIRISLDHEAAPAAVQFVLDEREGYRVHATIPARLHTQLGFQGFAVQRFEAPLLLKLDGNAALGAMLRLSLSEQIEVAIGDGVVHLAVEGDLNAHATSQTGHRAEGADAHRASSVAPSVASGRRDEQVRSLGDVLAAPDRTARLVALETLERPGDASVLPLIVSALQDPAPEVRMAAATALGRLGGRGEAPALLASFERDPDDRVRLASMLALAGLEVPAWLDAVHTAIRDPNEVLRCQAALLLGRRGGVASTGLLLEALGDPNPFVRLCAGTGLLATGGQEAIHAIARLVDEDEDVCVRMIGSIALGQTQDEEARRTLDRILESSEDVFVRRAVLYARAKQEGHVGAPGVPRAGYDCGIADEGTLRPGRGKASTY